MNDENTLMNEQIALEEQAVAAGVDQYRKLLSIKGHAETSVGRRLIAAHVDLLTAGIDTWLSETFGDGAGRRGKRASHAVLMKDIDTRSMAMLTLRSIFHSFRNDDYKETHVVTAARQIGQLIIEHVNWLALRDEKRALAKKVEKQVASTQNEKHRRRVTSHVTHSYLPPEMRIEWSQEDMIRVGLVLLELAEAHTQLITLSTVQKGKRRDRIVELTEKAADYLRENHGRAAELKPIYGPMIVPPKPWTTPTDGGYYTRRHWLVKNRSLNYQRILKEEDLSGVMDAVNLLQNTGYRVNQSVLTVVRQAWEENAQVGDLPSLEKLPMPAKPADISTNEGALAQYKLTARRRHAAEAQRQSKVLSAGQTLVTAEEFAKHDTIYFPHFLDWRGRAYCIPSGLQPQGSDVAKGLLQFSEGKALGSEGALWLKVHVANCFGIDKVSLDERVAWTDEHMDELLDSALFPLGSDEAGCGSMFWNTADKKKKWQALAACFELLGYSIEGEQYVSHLPIGMDGSCNGLQHLSAMLLDEAGAKATNVLPSDKPQDIYREVLDGVKEELVECMDAGGEGSEYAEMWLANDQLDRTLCKRPVMTKPYGVSAFGMRDQIISELQSRKVREGSLDEANQFALLSAGLQTTTEDPEAELRSYRFKSVTFLAQVIDKVINEKVVASKLVMDWLQGTARAAAAHNLPLSWRTPVGLLVLQDYRRTNSKVNEVYIGGQRRTFSLVQFTDQIDKKDQANGMSPNVVHSLDASHMMLTILNGRDAGITSYSMVHDSYATHACNTGLLNDVLRETFVEMYSIDILGGLHRQFTSQVLPQVAADMQEPPARGNLQLEAVMESDFFFA